MDGHILIQYFLFFLACSFVGWLMEEIWVGIRSHKVVNRGFLIGPLCPIYGIGAVFIVLVSQPFLAQPWLVAIISALGCATLEYLASFLLEKMFGARWWNYRDYPHNLHGRICLRYTVAFGLFGLLLAYLAYPAFTTLSSIIPEFILLIVSLSLAVVFLADFVTSIFIIKNFRQIRKTGERDDTEDITAYVRQRLAERGRLYRRLNSFDFVIGRVRVLHYRDYTDDLVENQGQGYQLPAGYRWIRRRTRPVLYFCGRIWARLHRLCTHTTYVNHEVLDFSRPIFIYGNHTQPIGDILAPVDYCGKNRPRLLASPANLGLPVLGPYLPDLGALPVPSTIKGLASLNAAITHYAKQNNPIIIYPEAHVWPYYTKIRPFPPAAFAYPVKNHAPAYAAVTTYQKRRFFKKPRRTIYFSGPFYPDDTLPRREQAKDLQAKVFAAMESSARHSNVKFIKYIKRG